MMTTFTTNTINTWNTYCDETSNKLELQGKAKKQGYFGVRKDDGTADEYYTENYVWFRNGFAISSNIAMYAIETAIENGWTVVFEEWDTPETIEQEESNNEDEVIETLTVETATPQIISRTANNTYFICGGYYTKPHYMSMASVKDIIKQWNREGYKVYVHNYK